MNGTAEGAEQTPADGGSPGGPAPGGEAPGEGPPEDGSRLRLRAALAGNHRAPRRGGRPSPSVDARALIAHAARTDRPLVLLDQLPEDFDAPRLTARREAREPLQLILGRALFRRLELRVRPGVFIPRPETEPVLDPLGMSTRAGRSSRSWTSAPAAARSARPCSTSCPAPACWRSRPTPPPRSPPPRTSSSPVPAAAGCCTPTCWGGPEPRRGALVDAVLEPALHPRRRRAPGA